MLNRTKSFRCLSLVALSALLAGAANAQRTPQATKKEARNRPAPAEAKPSLEPKAIDLLKAMSGKLSAAHTMAFTALETFESPSRQGHPLVYTIKSDVTLQRPNKLRVIMSADGPASEFYYDGKTMTAFAPAENLVAIAEAPPTIDAALEAAYHSAGTYFPFTDLIVADPYGDAPRG